MLERIRHLNGLYCLLIVLFWIFNDKKDGCRMDVGNSQFPVNPDSDKPPDYGHVLCQILFQNGNP